MVSQGAQTNGDKNNRRLMKSFSEVGQFSIGTPGSTNVEESHEPLQRTQSEEPPRYDQSDCCLQLTYTDINISFLAELSINH